MVLSIFLTVVSISLLIKNYLIEKILQSQKPAFKMQVLFLKKTELFQKLKFIRFNLVS
jgi:hypothetical protein